MDANPFEAPQAQGAHPQPQTPGVLDIGVALQDGWRGCWDHFPAWITVFLVGSLIFTFGGVVIIGIFLVWPPLFYGGINYVLRAHDGEAQLDDLFEGFRNYGSALGGMLGLGLLQMLVSIPGQILMQIGPFVGEELGLVLLAVGYVINLLWTFLVVVRFYFAPFFLVDQGFGVIDSFRASWEATQDQKLMSGLFMMISGMIVMMGLLACLIGMFPATMIAYIAWASAYRQLSGTYAQPATTG